MGLQGTNYPISYPEQTGILQEYMKLIHGDKYDPEKHRRVYSNSFIGPSSNTLQIHNIVPVNENTNMPNIRKQYTVTEKADGERHLLFISSKGKIYLINTNMNVLFTGTKTNEKTIYNSLLDGEHILYNKKKEYINLYAAFDIYFVREKPTRILEFVKEDACRYKLMQ